MSKLTTFLSRLSALTRRYGIVISGRDISLFHSQDLCGEYVCTDMADPEFPEGLEWSTSGNFYNYTEATPMTDPDNITQPFRLRPELASFAIRMEHVLQENDDKLHWRNMTQDILAHELNRNLNKLRDAVAGNVHGQTIKRAINVANYAMMLADNAVRKMERKHSGKGQE